MRWCQRPKMGTSSILGTFSVDFWVESSTSIKDHVPFFRDRNWLLYGIDLDVDMQLLTSPDVVRQSAPRDVRPVSFPALYTRLGLPAVGESAPTAPPAYTVWSMDNADELRLYSVRQRFMNFSAATACGRWPGKERAPAGRWRGLVYRSLRASARSVDHDAAAAAADATSHLAATPRDAVDRERRFAARQPRAMQRSQRFIVWVKP